MSGKFQASSSFDRLVEETQYYLGFLYNSVSCLNQNPSKIKKSLLKLGQIIIMD